MYKTGNSNKIDQNEIFVTFGKNLTHVIHNLKNKNDGDPESKRTHFHFPRSGNQEVRRIAE
jgi:hypothetical protein